MKIFSLSALFCLFICFTMVSCGDGNKNIYENDKVDYLYNQTITFYLSGDLKKAESGFLEIIKKYPAYGPAYIMLGKTYYFLNDFKKAEKSFLDSIHRGPNVTSYIWLAKIEGIRQNIQKGFDYLNKAYVLDFSNPLTHYELAKYYQSAKKYEKAIYHYNYAISYESMYAEMKLDLGALYRELGANEQAQNIYQDILNKGNLTLELRTNIQKMIENIKKEQKK